MNKIIISLITVMAAASMLFAGTTKVMTNSYNVISPGDVSVFKIFTTATVSADTIDTNGYVFAGPYPMTLRAGKTQFSKMTLHIEAKTSGDSAILAYHMVTGITMTDTFLGSWHLIATLLGTAATSIDVDLSGKSGQSIVFRLFNKSLGARWIFLKRMYATMKMPVTLSEP